jgi:hypothetical protein
MSYYSGASSMAGDAACKMRGHELYRVALARVGLPNSKPERGTARLTS